MIISPCISICKMDPVTGYCYGCARNNDEKKIWKDMNPELINKWAKSFSPSCFQKRFEGVLQNAWNDHLKGLNS